MTIDDLRAFIYLYQLRSFTKAARQFHLSQPELSKRIRRMEDELNIQLVDTSNRRHLKITPAGELVYHHASQIMAQFQGMMNELDKLRSSSLATFRVGTVPVAGQYGIASSIGEINHHFPQTEVQLLENEGDQILHQLKQGTIDAAILRDTQTQELSEIDYRCFPLTEDELVVVMDKHNPLASKKTVSIQDLKDVPIASLAIMPSKYTDEIENSSDTWRVFLIMGRRAKFSVQQKLIIIKKAQTESIERLAQEYCVNAHTIRRWKRMYKYQGMRGLESAHHNKVYSVEFKRKLVVEFEHSTDTLEKFALKHGLKSDWQLSQWIIQYNESKLKAYTPRKRDSIMTGRKTTFEERLSIIGAAGRKKQNRINLSNT